MCRGFSCGSVVNSSQCRKYGFALEEETATYSSILAWKIPRGSLMAQQVKNMPAIQEMQEMSIRSLGWEDPLEEEMATCSSILAQRIPWTEEPGGLQSMGSNTLCMTEHAHIYTSCCVSKMLSRKRASAYRIIKCTQTFMFTYCYSYFTDTKPLLYIYLHFVFFHCNKWSPWFQVKILNLLKEQKVGVRFSSIQLLSHIWLFVTPWTAARQAPLSVTNYWSLLRLMSIELLMPSNHLILCHPSPPAVNLSQRQGLSNEKGIWQGAYFLPQTLVSAFLNLATRRSHDSYWWWQHVLTNFIFPGKESYWPDLGQSLTINQSTSARELGTITGGPYQSHLSGVEGRALTQRQGLWSDRMIDSTKWSY